MVAMQAQARLPWSLDGRPHGVECAESAIQTNSSPARVGVRMLRDPGAGEARQRNGVGKVAVRTPQGRRVNRENGEGDMERNDMHSANTFLRTLEPMRVRDIHGRHAGKMCVRQQVCAHLPSHTR